MVIPVTVTDFVSPAFLSPNVPTAAEPSTVTVSSEMTPLRVNVPNTEVKRLPSYSLLAATAPFTVNCFAVILAVVVMGDGN